MLVGMLVASFAAVIIKEQPPTPQLVEPFVENFIDDPAIAVADASTSEFPIICQQMPEFSTPHQISLPFHTRQPAMKIHSHWNILKELFPSRQLFPKLNSK